MNKRLCLAAGVTAIGALVLCASFSFARGRLEEAADQRAKACNDAYWTCMGKCQDVPYFRGLCESNCQFNLRTCRDKANLPRTEAEVSPSQINPGTSATPKRPVDVNKVTGATVTASATPSRRTQDLEHLKTQKASPTPAKASPTPKPSR